MRVEVTPLRLSVVPGRPGVITVSVTNTASIISGHEIRVLGVDPRWVRLDQDRLSLFPDSAGVAVITVDLPPGIPAGVRQLEVEVLEVTEPRRSYLARVELTVPAELNLKLALDPVSTQGGRSATVGVIVENGGNAVVDVDLAGVDEEGAVAFDFAPQVPTLAPGEQIVGTARLRAPRPWFGSHKIRPFTIEAGPKSAPVIAYGSWLQGPRLTRGKLALIGLLAAATVFAIVIASTLSGLGHKSNQDLALALQVAQASTESHSGGTASISGTVRQLSSSTAVSAVTVTLFQAGDTSAPVVSTATGPTGGYHFAGLAAGSYKVEFDGSGFTELWYPQSLGAANANAITLSAGQAAKNINVYLGGIPATISGQVVGGDPTGALLTLETPPGAAGSGATGSGIATTALVTPTGGSVAPGTGSVVTTETLDATGDFVLADVPSPAVYDLVVTKTGYATTTQQVSLGGGEDRTGITIQLHKGDGSITGTVSSRSGPLGGATISASDSTTSLTTVSVTTPGKVGTFTLADLPTPDTLTVVVSAPGYASETLSVALAAGQQLTGLAVTLTSGVGAISGTVTTPAGSPAGGVTVVASDGRISKTTVTLSAGKVGSYSIGGLPVPGAYTITFSRADLQSQTRPEVLSAGTPDATNVDATLVANTAIIHGIVTQTGGGAVGNVTVTVDSGTTSYTVATATTSGPGTRPGSYQLEGIVPGTYTVSFASPGVLPVSQVVDLTAGEDLDLPVTLQKAASIYGTVVFAGDGKPAAGAEVRLYLTNQYPTVIAATVTTGTSGTFTFTGVQAPQSYIVGVAYPTGTPDQETTEVTTIPQQAVAACQSEATGVVPTTTVPTAPTTTSTVPNPTTTTTTTNPLGGTERRGSATCGALEVQAA